MKQNSADKQLTNLATVIAMEKLDKEYGTDNAVKLLGDEELYGKDLSGILESSLLGRFKNKETGEPLKLNDETLMSGLRNLLNRSIKHCEALNKEVN